MNIGEPKRVVTVEPITSPVPREVPIKTPAKTPLPQKEPVPA